MPASRRPGFTDEIGDIARQMTRSAVRLEAELLLIAGGAKGNALNKVGSANPTPQKRLVHREPVRKHQGATWQGCLAELQSPTRSRRACAAGPLQGHPGRQRRLPHRAEALHRAEPGARGSVWRCGRLALEQLPGADGASGTAAGLSGGSHPVAVLHGAQRVRHSRALWPRVSVRPSSPRCRRRVFWAMTLSWRRLSRPPIPSPPKFPAGSALHPRSPRSVPTSACTTRRSAGSRDAREASDVAKPDLRVAHHAQLESRFVDFRDAESIARQVA
jgi:hypothetical protein